MRILLVSDVHYRLRQFDWLFEMAGDVDVVVMAGDLLDIRSAVAVPAQAAAVTAQISRISERGTVLAASGNHDLDERDDSDEKVAGWLRRAGGGQLHVDGDSLRVGDTLFSVCGWWDGPSGQAALEARLAADAATRPARWIWIYHSPPAGSPLAWDGRREFGDTQARDWIATYQPDMVLAGHIHEAPFVEGGGWVDRVGPTWIFNAGSQSGPVPAHILIDVEANEATWLSATERASVALGS
jgi:Icc-related predicted phosphoesterase